MTGKHIDVHVHLDGGLGALSGGATEQALIKILARLEDVMATVTSVKQLVTDLDAETNAVAAKVDAQAAAIADLKAKLAAGSAVSQADLEGIANALTPISDRLKALGANPEAPIPPAV